MHILIYIVRLFEISDSNAWAIASNPEEAFTLIEQIKNSGIKRICLV